MFTARVPLVIGESIEYLISFPKAPGARALVRLRCVGIVTRLNLAESAFAATLERYEFMRESA
jgi:hypothetical protein